MTTPLVRPLTREILVGGTAYRVTLTTDRITLTPKGHRKGVELTWDELFALRDSDAAAAPFHPSDLPRPIAAEVAREVRAATEALTRVSDRLTQVGGLPAALLAETAPDPVHGRAERRDDWFVEPLLTTAEVASILRVSTRAVRRLPLRSILVGGDVRYRQSELRDYLRKQESRLR